MALLTRHLIRLFCSLAVAALLHHPALAQRVSEPEMKAVFLYKFTDFIEWPANGPQPPDSFRLCVIADSQMTATIDRTMKGESVNGRPIVTVLTPAADEVRQCHILFVGRGEMTRAQSSLAAVRDHPVLTVGESDGFLSQGGTIWFVMADNRVRFDINIEHAKRAGLTISSRLLQVARRVEGAPR